LSQSDLLTQLIDALRCLPGVGQKSAQRMAYQLLERKREGGLRLAHVLQESLKRITHCKWCRDFTEREICAICASPTRDHSLLCIVETPADRLVIEQATGFRGIYFILQGRLSPLDGMGPRELGLDKLAERMAEEKISEMIIATNPTVEGEATAHYLAQMARQFEVKPTRLAHGVPIGGELEYVDRGTLAHAFGSRTHLI
jgi:recombination protein RecR